MICPKCGAQAIGKFCGACGCQLQHTCSRCGCQYSAGDKFCSGCGGAIEPAGDGAGARSASVTIGDIGVMRGTIDQSKHTSTSTTIGAQTNISGDVHVHGQQAATYSELLAKGQRLLKARLYAQAIEAFGGAAQLAPREADALYYLALASLQGNRPRLVSMATARRVEQQLESAVAAQRNCGHAYLLWALVKEDAYVLNGINPRTPAVSDLLKLSGAVGRQYLAEIAEHVPARGNRIWEAIAANAR